MIRLNFEIGGGYAATGQDFSFAKVDEGNAAGIVDLAANQVGPAGTAKASTAVAMHCHPLLFEAVEQVVVVGFFKVEGLQLIVHIDSMAHRGFLQWLKFKLGKVAAVDRGVDLPNEVGRDFGFLRGNLYVVADEIGVHPWQRIGFNCEGRLVANGH